MDNLSDSCKGELESVTSTDSVQLITDEFQLRHLSTPDVSNIESSKRMALLELENERFRTDLENTRIELDSRIAANQGLKAKITELYVEVQSVLQEKQKLQNALTDTNSRLSIAESSVKWYQSQVHSLQACKKALQSEIDTYQEILKQRHQAIVCMNNRYKQLNLDYAELVEKWRKEKRDLQNEVNELKTSGVSVSLTAENETDVMSDLSTKLEVTEEELRDTKMELKSMEQRILNNEMAKISMETVTNKQRILISTMEETIQKCETEKNDIADRLRKMQLEIQKLRSDNETLQSTLLSSKHEQMQIEDAIVQLGSQLSKMLAQYKLLKSKNTEYEHRLSSMRDLTDENRRLKTLSYEANSSLLRKLRQQKQKIKSLENKLREERRKEQFCGMKIQTGLSLRDSPKQTSPINKDTKDRGTSSTKTSDESIDEGYADISTISSLSIDIPTPILINPVLLSAASDVLEKSKHLLTPIQTQVDKLQLKMERLQDQSIQANREMICCI